VFLWFHHNLVSDDELQIDMELRGQEYCLYGEVVSTLPKFRSMFHALSKKGYT
jgi:hypothetical protein